MNLSLAEGRPRRLTQFTPLRYPGGKGKLAAYVKSIMEKNGLTDGEYVEPYAGGAAIALELLFHEYVTHIHINDISRPVYAFWSSALNKTDELCKLVADTPLTVDAWDKQKFIFANQKNYRILEVGFAMFYLNRTNRSGVLNAGIIGGRDQSGPWKIDARYNARELIYRIQCIAAMKDRISLSRIDAKDFIRSGAKKWPSKTLIYCDPPYFIKGRDLYYNFYKHEDHQVIAEIVQNDVQRQKWIVSYDDVSAIRKMYEMRRHVNYTIAYSVRSAKQGTEVMFFDDRLNIPDLTGAAKLVDHGKSN